MRARSLLVVFAAVFMMAVASGQAADFKVCVASGPPFFYDVNGISTGIEFDILKSYADKNGMKMVLKQVHLQDVIKKVESGACDVAAARMSPTPSRERRVDFSVSYFPVRVAILQRKDRAAHSIADLAGKTIGVTEGSSLEDLVGKVPGVKLYTGRGRNAAEDASTGRIDGLAIDSVFVAMVLSRYPDLQISLFLPEQTAFAFPVKRNSEVKSSLNTHIEEIKRNGQFREILGRYFDEETTNLVLQARK